ncbi:hypothetical protein ACUNV4_14460 [Granulosicoccus sp. 3-233]|uniref:hypothetical protein n=1 Tax=Granulosicoccus sp. 3-233 TaxID=3417969 RepID=UPI003D347182
MRPRLPAGNSGPGYFYLFLGTHSLLIGLLPFFLPVYLWQHGLGLAGLSLMIGLSGLGFTAALGLWQALSRRWQLKHLVALTFILELLLLGAVGLVTTVPGAALFTAAGNAVSVSTPDMIVAAAVLGLFNGLYNAFFWTTQRTLFMQLLGKNDTGRQYGNFQIFVMVFLKIGILLGGVLLDTGGFVWLLALSAGTSLIANLHLAGKPTGQQPLARHDESTAVTLRDSIAFRDKRGSQPIFLIDGVFLYLESHFWTLTLFLVVQEDFGRLGLAVVVLALTFAALFYLIKNRIDQLASRQVYQAAVWLYLGSWLLRFTLNDDSGGPSLWMTLIFITFFSSFFRLAFNKRFYDVARTSGSQRYLLMKSYSSQFWLGGCFSLLAVVLLVTPLPHDLLLQYLYLPAALLSVLYLRYSDGT